MTLNVAVGVSECMRRDVEDFGLSEVSASSKQWSPSFFQTAGKLKTLVAPIVMPAEATKLCEVVLISKKSVCGYVAFKKIKNDEMRVEDRSGAVCCVQAEAFEFSCWESECIHSFHPERSRNGQKGTIWTRSLWSGNLPLSCSCAVTFFLSFFLFLLHFCRSDKF